MTDDPTSTDPVHGSTDRQASPASPEQTVDVRAVKAALARLASARDGPDPTQSPAAVVDEAVAATGRLADAAAFVAADGRERLATAVDRLEAQGRTVPADRGAAVLADLAAFREAADGGTGTEDGPSDAGTTFTPPTERL